MQLTAIQFNPIVGAIKANTQCVLQHIKANPDANLILFPELTLTGYPPEDLLYRPDLYQQIDQALTALTAQCKAQQTVIIGHPVAAGGKRYNQLSVIQNRCIAAYYRKQALPNYATFDEQRYFSAGDTPQVIHCHGVNFGLLICEDVWTDSVVAKTIAAGAECLLISNASPYEIDKQSRRVSRVEALCKQYQCSAVYLNWVGGQDELVFDGCSFYVNAQGKCTQTAAHCQEDTLQVGKPIQSNLPANRTEALYQTLVLGIRDYVNKNHFPGVLLGLSGGIDSALTLALAVDALGPKRVHAVMLPSRHTSQMSLDDAATQAEALGCAYQVIDIETSYQAFLQTLAPHFAGLAIDATEENIQARCRGVILMAVSNKTGNMVLVTGNKSEMAVGYSTLYGDLAGGFAPLKDIYKTNVYKLSRYRNHISSVIPERVLTRAPSAELAENQTDQDSLPDYAVLDQLIQLIIHDQKSTHEILQQGFDANVVNDVTRRIYRNEYKRRQAPIGIRVSEYAFGRDRRYPITSGYQE